MSASHDSKNHEDFSIKILDKSIKNHNPDAIYSSFSKISIDKYNPDEVKISENIYTVNQIELTEQTKLHTKFDHKENSKNFSNFELKWIDLDITAKITDKKTKKQKDKIILNKVSGIVKSGECLGIIGSSGAGKTTLMNYLSRKIGSSNLQSKGEIQLNNKNVDPDIINRISCYVMQDDILEATMTPLEILMFTAKLKLNLSEIEVETRVSKMIKDLHLTHCLNTRVGSTVKRGVSGGERKRTSIGVELISDPKIIFLDEPTTGLDSYNAYEVIMLLKKLSKEGKIVIYTIHQPSSEIFYILDKICILAAGKSVYFGPQSKCFECFNLFNIPVPPNYNPFEHFIEMTNVTSIMNEKVLSIYPSLNDIENKESRYEAYVDILNRIYEDNRHKFLEEEATSARSNGVDNNKNSQEISTNHGLSDDVINNYVSSKRNFCYELFMLLGRGTLVNLRNSKILVLRIVQNMFVGLFIAALYFNLSREMSGIQDRRGLLFITLISNVFGAITTTLLSFPEEKKVFLRERSNGLYRVSSFVVARSISEIPVFFIASTLFALVVYWTAFLNDTFSYKYYTYVGILLLSSLVGASFSLALSSLISNQGLLINVNTLISIPLLLLSGFFANAGNFAPYLIPFEYLSTYKYAFQSLIHNEFASIQPFYCFNSGKRQCYQYIVQNAFREPFYISLIGLGCLYVLFKLLAFIFIFYFNKIKV